MVQNPTPAAELSRDLQAIIADYQEIWLSRNRPGGLKDSQARLERACRDYNMD